MKSPDSSGNFKPFKDLKALLEKKAIELKSVSKPKPNDLNKLDEKKVDLRSDRTIFQEAMADVKKISKPNYAVPSQTTYNNLKSRTNFLEEEHESVVQLKELIKNGTGFIVS